MNNYSSNIYPSHLIDELRGFITRSKAKNVVFPKFVFLCGKANETGKKTNRDWIQDYIKRTSGGLVVPVLSEILWELDGSESGLDLLSFEDFLAEASDVIILFIESYGTACELGAFAMKEKLVDKLVVFNDNQFISTKSFINDGPIEKIKSINETNVIYTDLNAIFSNYKLINKLNEVINQNNRLKINRDYSQIHLKSFIVEMLELISILQPIKQDDLIRIYKNLKNFSFRFDFTDSLGKIIRIPIKTVFSLLKGSNLIFEDCGYFNLVTGIPRISFMFDLNLYQSNLLRTKFLVRKYKYDSQSMLKKVD